MTISRITPDNGASYMDHEFMYDELGNLWMCWQHLPQNEARVARINTLTGHFLDSDDGLDIPVAGVRLASLSRVGKGPSLVRDQSGWYMVYNRMSGQDVEIWESRPELDENGIPLEWKRRKLTGAGVRQNVLPILEWERDHYVLTCRGDDFCYLTRTNTTDVPVRPRMSGSHRACGPYYVSVTHRQPRNIHLTHVDTGETTQITDDIVNLFDPYWIEHKGRHKAFAMGLVEQNFIQVYAWSEPHYYPFREIRVPHKALRGYPREEIGVQSAEFFRDHEGHISVDCTWKATRDPILETPQSEIWKHPLTGPNAGRAYQVSKPERGVVTHEGEPYRSHKADFVWYGRVHPETGRVEIWVNTDPTAEPAGAFARGGAWLRRLVSRLTRRA